MTFLFSLILSLSLFLCSILVVLFPDRMIFTCLLIYWAESFVCKADFIAIISTNNLCPHHIYLYTLFRFIMALIIMYIALIHFSDLL